MQTHNEKQSLQPDVISPRQAHPSLPDAEHKAKPPNRDSGSAAGARREAMEAAGQEPSPPEPPPARAAPARRAGSAHNRVPRSPLSPSPQPPGLQRARLSPARIATAAALRYLPAEHRGSAPAPALPADRRDPFPAQKKRPLSVGRSCYHVRETRDIRTPRPPSLLRAAPAAGGAERGACPAPPSLCGAALTVRR